MGEISSHTAKGQRHWEVIQERLFYTNSPHIVFAIFLSVNNYCFFWLSFFIIVSLLLNNSLPSLVYNMGENVTGLCFYFRIMDAKYFKAYRLEVFLAAIHTI